MIRIDGKVVLITGAARGQGAATVKLFAQAGATVYGTDVDAGPGEQALAGHGTFLSHDVTRADDWARVVGRVLDAHGRIDVLVNNAAIIEYRGMLETTPELWQRTLAVNQSGPLYGMQAVAPAMKRQKGGSIVNVSSIGGLRGASMCFAYGATKWALRGMTKSAAQELGPFGIRVNAVLPGPIDTRMIEKMDHAATAQRLPLRRIGQPEEVARLSLWLASDLSSYVTGGDYVVDGGTSA
jgi:3alpha(or 20beta)-hydroxysteroid dehydrogenase